MKGINRIIDMLVSSGKSGEMSLNSDGLLGSLATSKYEPKHWWEIPYQKGLRLILILCSALMMLTAILYYGIYYINDVVLYENKLTINEQGAFNPIKSLNCEYALYLFNTADLWANSGIQVNKKDRIRISISGAFNSSVEGTIVAAKNNTQQRYHWLSYDKNPLQSNDTSQEYKKALDLCIARGDSAFSFGNVMYAIYPESGNLQSYPMKLSLKLTPELEQKRLLDKKHKNDSLWHPSFTLLDKKNSYRFHKANKTGTLYFAVNDMYFNNDEEMESYYRIAHNFSGNYFTQEEIDARSNKPKHDYEDNLGQLLVTIEIQRHNPLFLLHPTMAYRFFEYNVNESLDYDIWGPIGKYVRCFGCLVLFSIWITFLFGLYLFTLLTIIYVIFFVGHKLALFFGV